MKKMKRIIGVLLLIVLLLTGCANESKDIVLSSSVNCVVTVPRSIAEEFPVFFQLPFYRIYSGEDAYSKLLDEQFEFVVGKDAFLTGTNVEELDGAIITVGQVRLADIIGDDFYDSVGNDYSDKDFKKTSSKHSNRNYVKKTIVPYVRNSHLLTIHFLYDGCISNEVSVKRLSIPYLELDYFFECLKIDVMEVPENVRYEKGESLISYISGDGLLSGSCIAPSGYTFVEGFAVSEIKEISMFSANSVCEVITEDNYPKYKYLEDTCGSIFTKQKLKDYAAGEEISLEFSYALSADEKILQDNDVIMVSLIMQTVDADGNIHWGFHYEPNIREGAFLLRNLLKAKDN